MLLGCSDSSVYDVEMRKITLKLEGHADDINAVCFADPVSTNVLFSGSDDSVVKVWDRRSMAGGREAGCLVGHMEGITFVSSKGDGRYVITNGKDQTLKLWDIRMMMERTEFDKMVRKDYNSGFDYRWMVQYPSPRVACPVCGLALPCSFYPCVAIGQSPLTPLIPFLMLFFFVLSILT